MEEKEIKFGNKDFGRTPIERLIILLEKKGILRQVINLLFLVILVGINSQIHNDTTKGVQFLIIVFLILYSGNESTTNFFGAATLAIFITIHFSMFGFNAIALILTFTIFLLFKKRLEKNFLGPISIYLFIDTLYIYLDLQFTGIFSFLSNYLFSENAVIILLLIPATNLFLIVERQSKKTFTNRFLNKYFVFISLAFLFGIAFFIGIILSNSALIYVSYFLLIFYAIGTFIYKNQTIILLLPIAVIILIAYVLNAFN
ncbi:hypothetical protein VBD025_15830 [Virgibacillus flavescens]|uniref:hypothetical protein n=1 Tax=Virgibacillus flavescens TaxID=1611422 RepID=UPI003D34B8AD